MKKILLTAVFTLFFYINCNCTEIVNQVPSEYFEGVKSVTFIDKPIILGSWYSYQRNELSYYFWNSERIKIYEGCSLHSLTHELAHHQQKLNGVSLYQARQHDDNFKFFYDKIRGELI